MAMTMTKRSVFRAKIQIVKAQEWGMGYFHQGGQCLVIVRSLLTAVSTLAGPVPALRHAKEDYQRSILFSYHQE